MKRLDRFAIACTLVCLAACGPDLGESDTGTDSGSGDSTTEPIPLTCGYGDQIYDDGEEFETPDGCVRYRCEGGGLTTLADERVTVAGDLDLPSQADVDQQTCLSVVDGSLTISGEAADLTPLAQLTRVGGTLDITASDAVTLHGLEALAEIGGSIVIADNMALTTLSFQVYMSVFGDVTIQNNDALASLAGAEFIGQCTTCSARAGGLGEAPAGDAAEGGAEPSPTGDEGFDEPGGGTFYGKILIADNDVLTDIFALSNLYYAWADVRLRNNAALTSLAGLQLAEVQGDLEISNHAAMSSADAEAFAAGIDVWGLTTLCGNLGGVACP
jgi:hypothetical protein